MSVVLKNCTVLTPFIQRNECNVVIKNKLIHSITKSDNKLSSGLFDKEAVFDIRGKYLIPGLIDIHTHGANGVDCSNKNMNDWKEYNSKNGVTSFIPTIMTIPFNKMCDCVCNIIENINKTKDSSKILGINMEGPYINPKYGAQEPYNCMEPSSEKNEFFFKIANNIKIMTIAPEVNGSSELIKELIRRKIVVSIGHTNASKNQTIKAISLGANLATHIFNAFGYPKGLIQKTKNGKVCGIREVKALDVLLENNNLYAEVIVDKNGAHVSPTFLKILIRCKPIDKIILITDNIKAAGLPYGDYEAPDGRAISISEKSDVAWLKEQKTLFGSIFKLKDSLKNLIKHTGVELIDALKTATINPARLLKLDNKIGSIEEGKIADCVVVDDEFNVFMTIINGEIVYKKQFFELKRVL